MSFILDLATMICMITQVNTTAMVHHRHHLPSTQVHIMPLMKVHHMSAITEGTIIHIHLHTQLLLMQVSAFYKF